MTEAQSRVSEAQANTARLEMACVGALVTRPELADAFFQQLPLEEFSPGTGYIAHAVMGLLDSDSEITAMSVLEQLRTDGKLERAGGGPFLYDCIAAGNEWVDAHAAIETLSRLFGLRDAWATGIRLQQAATSMELPGWVSYAKDQVDRIDRIAAGAAPPNLTYLADVLTGEDVSVDWCVPGLLPKATATMLTAPEGLGKSTVLRQIALAAAAGLSAFEPYRTDDSYEPQRVVLVDCEVPRNQLIRSLRHLWSYGVQHAPHADTMAMVVESHQGGIDLTDGKDQAWLHHIVRHHRADLLVIGPVYRLTSTDLNTEEGVRAWQKPLESMMADGVTVVTEHHAPNESAGHARSLRPIGSSAMRRWFAQGVSMRGRPCAEHEDEWCRLCRRRARVENWRGSREEEVAWPHYLTSMEGQVWWIRDQYAENM